jgi:hypothetical protein
MTIALAGVVRCLVAGGPIGRWVVSRLPEIERASVISVPPSTADKRTNFRKIVCSFSTAFKPTECVSKREF